MVDSYIQLNYDALTSTTGKRLYLKINTISRNKGTNTTDLPIPSKSSSARQLLPLSGQINNFTINASLTNVTSSIGFNVTSISDTLVDANITTIKQQYNFLFDELLRPGITAKYKLYLEWLDKTYSGYCTITASADRNSFENEVIINIEFKEGTNFLATS